MAERTTGALPPPVRVCMCYYHVHVGLYAVYVRRVCVSLIEFVVSIQCPPEATTFSSLMRAA